MANRNVTIQLVGSTTTNSTWKPLIEATKNTWNNSKAGTNITLTTATSNHTLEVGAYAWTALAQTIKTPSGDVVATSSVIQINTNTTSTLLSDAKQSTIAHEMGHLFWLGDNPDTTETSLMSYKRDRNMVNRPQYIDAYHVVDKYS